jgi:hypothetical protein
MKRETPPTEALMKELMKLDPETGLRNWERLVAVVREKAESGDVEFAKLLERVDRLEALFTHEAQ